MPYEPKEWVCGDAITADAMNKMERGIADMDGEYTPNEWSCGDVITAEKLNHMEQGIANGGGGSSDFSTAEVTVILGSYMEDTALTGLPHIDNGSLRDTDLIAGDEGDRIVFSVPLYKGVLETFCAGEVYAENVTGGIVMDSETGVLTITGDGTITVTVWH